MQRSLNSVGWETTVSGRHIGGVDGPTGPPSPRTQTNFIWQTVCIIIVKIQVIAWYTWKKSSRLPIAWRRFVFSGRKTKLWIVSWELGTQVAVLWLWKYMNTHVYIWMSMRTRGCPFISWDIHRYRPWPSVDYPWIIHGLFVDIHHGSSAGMHGSPLVVLV